MRDAGRFLDALTWCDVEARDLVLVVPVGSTEQHGPHLPFTTDTEIALAVAARLAERRDDVVIAPAIPYGASGEHAAFAGTLSIGRAALEVVVVELVRSADAFAGVVLVSAHGGNAAPLAAAVGKLESEGRRVLVWAPRIPDGDLHAGRTETSLMLAVRPQVVRLADAQRGDTRALAELAPMLRDHGVGAVSPNGVLGDPAGSSSEEGVARLDALADDLAHAVGNWR